MWASRPRSERAAGPAPEDQHDPSANNGSPSTDNLPDTGASTNSPDAIDRIARFVRLEIVEPARALPLLSPLDYRLIEGYAQVYEITRTVPVSRPRRPQPRGRWWDRLMAAAENLLGAALPNGVAGGDSAKVVVTEVMTPDRWQRYEDEVLVAEGENSLGQIPLVHIQNTAMPFEYAGTSDVEGLIPIQDELNTRLSDRANRIALQSFKMYLAKGVENFLNMPVQPGRMWVTDNENAELIEFGGAAESGAETLHIADLREALDKASGVSPIAAGAIKDRIGRLTSAAALRITLISLLARTDRKRTTYGLGIARMVELALAWLDRAGLFATRADERGIELHWPSPLPENLTEQLDIAEAKLRIGVPREQVLRELGY